MSRPPGASEHPSSPSQANEATERSETPWDDTSDDDMDYEEAEELMEGGLEDADFQVEFVDASDEPESRGETTSRETTEEPSGDNDDEGEHTEREQTGREDPRSRRTIVTFEELEHLGITRTQLLQMLGGAGVRGLFRGHRAFDDDESDYNLRPRRPRSEFHWPPVPAPEGQKLIEQGVFGVNEPKLNSIARQKKKKLAYRTMMRELGLQSPGIERARNRILRHEMLPSAKPDISINFESRGYSGQFSDDGNFFFTCSQDFNVRMYDTSNPFLWKYYKMVRFYGGQWTITDATLSPDNKYLAYSSIRPQVCLAHTDPDNDSSPQSLDFSNMGHNSTRPARRFLDHWGIWSLRFSGDGREIVCGTSDSSIYVYDMEAGHSILNIRGHTNDVNAVCYGDKASPHILYSGSDDCTIKVWDRRSLGDGREAGAFIGHTEGLTYVDSKGDGRYVISNAKDQTMKLWDLRRMIPPEKAADMSPGSYSSGWDYRYPPYDETERRANPHDCSLVTFRGHSVASTLIRCHFSPAGSTDGRYVYSGSHDGSIYIWHMNGELKSKLEVSDASTSRTAHSQYGVMSESRQSRILRDVSWHPYAPVIATTSWNGGAGNSGTTTIHSWNDDVDEDEGEPRKGIHVDARLNQATQSRRRARRPRYDDEDDGDDGMQQMSL